VRSRDKVTAGLAAAILTLAVLGVGGAPRAVMVVLGVLVAAALGAQITSRRSSRVSPLLYVTGLAAGLTALQLVPLPSGLVAALDPTGAELRADGAALLGDAVGWMALSRDPSSTAFGLIYLVLLCGVAVVALRIGATERGRFALVGAVAAIGTLAAVITGLHHLAGATALYGWYRPDFATPRLLGPLLNPNHLGCLFAVAAVTSAGLVLHAKQPTPWRGLWALCALVTIAATLTTLSRGATLALLTGGAILAGLLLGQRWRGRVDQRTAGGAGATRLSVNAVAIGVVAVCSLALIVYSSGKGVSEQLRTTSGNEWSQPGSKYMAWRSALTLVEEAPWLGVGRGAFEASFTRVHEASSKVTFSHPENEYVQAVVEWGLLGALALAVVVAWTAVAAARRWRLGPLTAAAMAGCTVVAVQSFVDFGLELPGIAVPTIALLASLVHVPLRELPTEQRRRHALGRGVATAGLTLATAGLLLDGSRRISEDHRALVTTSPSSFRLAQAVIERHPHDYLAFAYAGDALARARDPRAMGFLNHALRLHPTHPGTHRAAARLLLRSGATHQAALEYATAIRNAWNPAPLVQEVVRAFPDPELAASAIPVDGLVPEQVARALVDAKAAPVALRWLRKVAVLRPHAPRVGELLYRAALQAGDPALAETAARLRCQQEESAEAQLALGQLLVKRGALDQAAAVLTNAATTPGRPETVSAAWMLSCDVAAERSRWAEAKGCLLALREAQQTSALLVEIARRLQRVDAADHSP
jgi:O-antigen ligase